MSRSHLPAAESSHASRPRGPFFGRLSGRSHVDSPPFFQPKLTIGAPGDRFEQEADRVADQVVAGESAPAVQRACAGCAGEGDELRRRPMEEEEEMLQTEREPVLRRQPAPGDEDEEELVQARSEPAAGGALAPGVIRRSPAPPAGGEDGELTVVPAEQVGIDVQEAKKRSVLPVRRRIRVGAIDDPAEREADRIAASVLAMSEPPEGARPTPAALSPHDGPSLQTLRASPAPASRPSPAAGVTTARLVGDGGTARPLARATREFYEPRFGLDLSPVRLHEGPQAARVARQLNARAFAYGTDVWLGAGESESNRPLMAHELAHVAQASAAAAPARTLRRVPAITTMTVQELGFTGDHTITGVTGTLGSTTSKIDDPDGSAPVWTSGGTREPVAYTKNTAPTLFGTFVVPSGSPTVTDVGLRVLLGTTAVGYALGQMIAADRMDVSGVQLDASVVGSSLGDRSRSLGFEFTTDQGSTWFGAGAATVRIFATEGTPTPPGGDLRADVLNFATAAALAGSSPAEGLRAFVQSGVTYDPSVSMPGDFTNSDKVLNALSVPHQCDSQAYLMRYLAKSLGIAADVKYFWEGRSSGEVMLFTAPALGMHASFQCDRPAEDRAVNQPHFTFHAFTEIGGNLHDATYGLGGLPGIRERAPGTSNQRGDRSTFQAASWLIMSWNCAH